MVKQKKQTWRGHRLGSPIELGSLLTLGRLLGLRLVSSFVKGGYKVDSQSSFFWSCRVVGGIQFSDQELNPGPELGAQSLSHRTAREVPLIVLTRIEENIREVQCRARCEHLNKAGHKASARGV